MESAPISLSQTSFKSFLPEGIRSSVRPPRGRLPRRATRIRRAATALTTMQTFITEPSGYRRHDRATKRCEAVRQACRLHARGVIDRRRDYRRVGVTRRIRDFPGDRRTAEKDHGDNNKEG